MPPMFRKLDPLLLTLTLGRGGSSLSVSGPLRDRIESASPPRPSLTNESFEVFLPSFWPDGSRE